MPTNNEREAQHVWLPSAAKSDGGYMYNIEVSVVIPTFNRREMLREMLVEL